MLKVNEIDVFYGSVQILWRISLEVKEGEITSVVGANGVGKSTLLKTISGILRPASGSIEFLDQDISNFEAYQIVELGLIQIPERRRIFSEMTVLENLLTGSYTRRAKKNRNKNFDLVFKLFPALEERKKQIAGTLSGGEQQMLAIARGLMSEPKLLMLDEPSLGLMPILVDMLFELIKKLNDEGITILLVEQNIGEALSIADKGYLLSEGRVALKGKGKDLLGEDQIKRYYLGL